MTKKPKVPMLPTLDELLTCKLPVDSKFVGIAEYELVRIKGKWFNEDSDKALALLRLVYELVLWKDPFWHFFYEGQRQSLLRFSTKYAKRVEAFLRKEGVEFKPRGPWMDCQGGTSKYQKVFTYLFHGFSLLALETKDEDMFAVGNRVLHCYLNHNWYRYGEYRKRYGEAYWESSVLCEYANLRAGYQMYWQGYYKAKVETATVARSKAQEEKG